MKIGFGALIAALFVLPFNHAIAQKPKTTVAVSSINDIAHTGQAAAFQQMIETAISSTGKFRVISRNVGGLLAEQHGAKAGLYTSNTPGKIGGFEGASYLIEAAITAGQSTQKTNWGKSLTQSWLNNAVTGGHQMQSCTNAVAVLAVDVSIKDASSGEIIYATRINEQQQSAASCGEHAQADVAQLLRSAADKTATGLLVTMYPIMVAAVQSDGSLVLNYGEAAVTPQAIMAVHAIGQEIHDPQSGEVISHDETTLGLIRVTDVQARISHAVPLSAFTAPPPIGSVVRGATTDEQSRFAPSKSKRR